MPARSCLLLFFMWIKALPLQAQATQYPVEKWAKALSEERDASDTCGVVIGQLFNMDSTTAEQLLADIEKNGNKNNAWFRVNLLHLSANHDIALYLQHGQEYVRKRVYSTLDAMLKAAQASEDTALMGMANFNYARVMYGHQDVESAAFYASKALQYFDSKEPAGFIQKNYLALASILYQNREYAKCIHYTLKGLSQPLPDQRETATYLNTVGQAYYQLKARDSASYYFHRSIQMLENVPQSPYTSVWKGINHTGIGLLYYDKGDFDTAGQIFALAYAESKDFTPDLHPAGTAATWMGKTFLAKQHYDSAASHFDKASRLIAKYPPELAMFKARSLDNLLQSKAELFNRLGRADSFHFYNQQYLNLHDSLERVALLGSNKIIQLRITSEADQLRLQKVTAAKKQAELTRNFIIASIVMLSLIAIMVLNRKRQKAAYKEQLALQQQKLAEANMAMADAEKKAALEQLELFTHSLVEKTRLIEQLEQHAKQNEQYVEAEQWKDKLSRQPILTEEDWLTFKTLFEKGYPGFFARLRQEARDVTAAEQRMAALTRLQLNTKEMATVLGISPNSVIKAKHRLRQRLNTQGDINLEEFIDAL